MSRSIDNARSGIGTKRTERTNWSALGEPAGLLGWLSVTTHQAIGMRYIITAFIFLLLGRRRSAADARCNWRAPNNTFLSPDRYNQIFTLHGTTMMFLFAVPVMEGMGVYLVPLMLGTRNVAFPRLNAFGYWMYLAGGLLLYGAAVHEHDAGRRLVRVPAALGPAILAGQRRRRLGADDYVHGDLGAVRRDGTDRHHLQDARAGNVAEPHSDVLLVACWCNRS